MTQRQSKRSIVLALSIEGIVVEGHSSGLDMGHSGTTRSDDAPAKESQALYVQLMPVHLKRDDWFSREDKRCSFGTKARPPVFLGFCNDEHQLHQGD